MEVLHYAKTPQKYLNSGIHATDCMRENVWKVSPLSINIGKKMQLFGEFGVVITTGLLFREKIQPEMCDECTIY